MEIGLTEKPSVAQVHTGRSPRYSPIEIPRYQDVRETLALIDLPDLPSPASPEPSQFMLVLGDVVTNIALTVSTGAQTEVSLVMDAEAAEDLAERIMSSGQGSTAPRVETTVSDCDDLIVGYQLFGRALGGKWTKYLYGPLTMRCPLADKAHPVDGLHAPVNVTPAARVGHHQFDHGTRSGSPGAGSPNGPFSGEFLSDQSSDVPIDNSAPSRILLELIDPTAPDVIKEDLRLPCEDDVDSVVLHVDVHKVHKELLSEVPIQFKVTFGENIATTYLVPLGSAKDATEFRMVLDAAVLRDIVMKINNTDEFYGYDDVRINYMLSGRALGGPWRDYAGGLVLFDCADSNLGPGSDFPPIAAPKTRIAHKFDHGVPTCNPGQGSPHGGFGPAFLADETEDDV